MRLGLAFALAALAGASCVLPSGGISLRDQILQVTPRPSPSLSALLASPGAGPTAAPGQAPTATPVETGRTPSPSPPARLVRANLTLLADLNLGTPEYTVSALPARFGVAALPPNFGVARYQLTGPALIAPLIGDLEVDRAAGRGTARLESLEASTYLLTVVVLDPGGQEIGAATASITLPPGAAATTSIRIATSGRQNVRLDIADFQPPTPSFKVNGL
jgi:hypothetical protein